MYMACSVDLGVFVHAGGSAMFIVSDREVFSFSCSIRVGELDEMYK